MSEQSVARRDITFFVLSIFFSGVLNSIIGELHYNLILICYVWIVLFVFFGACSYITFFEAVKFSVIRIQNGPNSDVEFTIAVEQWFFNQLLDNESKTFELFFFIFVCCSVASCYVIMIVCLENAHFITLASTNAVTFAHYFSELVKCLENMNSNSSIEARWLQQPQVLSTLTTPIYLI